MGKKKIVPKDDLPKIRPATTPEGRENQMIAIAIDQVEQRMRDGTASSAEYVHFLKLASSKERLEKEKLELEKELLQAKTEAIQSQKRVEETYQKALNAMRRYAGEPVDDEEELY